MNRRSFFRRAGIGTAAIIAAPGVLTSLVENPLPVEGMVGFATQFDGMTLCPETYSELIAIYGGGFHVFDFITGSNGPP